MTDDALLYDLCGRARRARIRVGGTEAGLRGLTDLISAAADPARRYSHAQLVQLIDAAPEPVGFRWGLRRLETVSASRTDPPGDWSEEERGEYTTAQTALLRLVGRDSGEPRHGAVTVVRNVLEQFLGRWL
ncbi:hypothetical protein [Curtobacterium sp. MCSS17_016]|uniref:hypothetical protein n=1 Tax=Curtobacterium sp. MCSS17_016 TaxID=2175644 RepID=UPI0011B849BE|nr:hypothetical protein [Curtobacterium sp. MCSS17_016]WIE81478.1 hypothetical protein DEJ19_019775 [Curtobacterium sp. MCSS17_016]